ncbi:MULTISPECIES: hypothetical protein [unclassified Streptomyces]|uniref:hypothetical protein n=1 Tax=unclassified Streptomyces TaxID=2593676 RepID=UPI001F04D792|nr:MULTISPECIES: hypothetical protein [unclassified Streptomyces]MCH0565899.1 hypothetical protein [Streptomyces sp. MUM 2J]MCH0569064.1 hypothetical protein [Streptomyces sp. MUM 136J]
MTWYWGRTGFRLDDTLGWIGAVVGTAGLAMAVFGAAAAGRDPDADHRVDSREGERTSGGAVRVRMKARASGKSRVYQAGRDQTVNDA